MAEPSGVRASYYTVKIVRQTLAGDVSFDLGRIQVPDEASADIADLLGTPLVSETVNWTTLTEGDRLELLAASARRFTNLASLNADTELTLDAGKVGTVAEGDIIEARSFRFSVAADDATDHHRETAGGLKLYARPNETGHIDILQFGDGLFKQANIDMIEADFGRVGVSVGTNVAANARVTAPIYFSPGAFLSPGSGVTVEIKDDIIAPKQWIFRGNGGYELGRDSGGDERGEGNREVLAEWFGMYAHSGGVDPGEDMADYLQIAMDALGNSREGLIHFGNGSYHFKSTTAINRAITLKFPGTRRGVVRVHGDGYPVFTSNGDAVRIEGANFEMFVGGITSRDSPCIHYTHDECSTDDIRVSDVAQGIILEGNRCRAENTSGVYSHNPGAGSSIVNVRGKGCTVLETECPSSSAYEPEALVNAGGGASENIVATTIRGLYWFNDAIGALLNAEGGDITSTSVSAVRNHSASDGPPSLAKLVGSGEHDISAFIMSDWLCNALTDNIMDILRTGTGKTEKIILGEGAGGNGSGYFFNIACEAGAVQTCRIGGDVIPSDRGGFSISGAAAANVTGLRKPLELDENGLMRGVWGIPEDTDDLVISSGEITLPANAPTAIYRVDTEGNAGSDTLTTINGGVEGQIIILKTENSSRDVTLDDNAGNLRIAGDFTMDTTQDRIWLQFDGTNWFELGRVDNA